jgi:hypothetical protein
MAAVLLLCVMPWGCCGSSVQLLVLCGVAWQGSGGDDDSTIYSRYGHLKTNEDVLLWESH